MQSGKTVAASNDKTCVNHFYGRGGGKGGEEREREGRGEGRFRCSCVLKQVCKCMASREVRGFALEYFLMSDEIEG